MQSNLPRPKWLCILITHIRLSHLVLAEYNSTKLLLSSDLFSDVTIQSSCNRLYFALRVTSAITFLASFYLNYSKETVEYP
ncbi:hypothetical protein F4825DRAFT_410755 [Nemania diffusa]|nr:hypothetical protein F4825DRAFT_410755 [Nemania diffusa]